MKPELPRLLDEPDDELTRLANRMAQLAEEHGGVTGIVLLDGKETGCVHSFGYPRTQEGAADMLANLTEHLMWAGRVTGVGIEVLANGRKVPFPEPEE